MTCNARNAIDNQFKLSHRSQMRPTNSDDDDDDGADSRAEEVNRMMRKAWCKVSESDETFLSFSHTNFFLKFPLLCCRDNFRRFHTFIQCEKPEKL